ncbi:oxidative stress survival, Svf1-like protein [Pilobolus umbonatus]|nr:oxidative stress survival, Svf1-like protein [Pilobolus umbonatus]
MSSWFSQITSTVSQVTGVSVVATNEEVKTVKDTATDGCYYNALTAEDLQWALSAGSATENQIFYLTTKSGGMAFVQLIYSGLSLFKPTISFTCRFYDPASNTNTFKNINQSSEFKLSSDRQSVKSEYVQITLNQPMTEFKIVITHPELTVDLTVARVDKGFKVGEGKTYLGGQDQTTAAGIVSHKFWPRCRATGTMIVDKVYFDIEAHGMFIHAIQGMQPQLCASHWNFVNFQGDKASLGMMQFTTTKQYGSVNVNQGSIVVDDKLVSVSVDNQVELMDLEKDKQTGFMIPKKVKLTWKGKTLEGDEDVSVVMVIVVKNLIDKIDILQEIPYLLRKLVQTLMKPYIYQWLDDATAEITVGDKVITCTGKCYQELVFVSSF